MVGETRVVPGLPPGVSPRWHFDLEGAALTPAKLTYTNRRSVAMLLPMLLFAAITLAGSLWVAHRNAIARGGDAAGYCLAARYDPIRDQFDNPAHGWGYPLAIKALSAVTGDEFRAGQGISIVCAAIYMAFAALFCFGTLPRSLAWLACALIAVHPAVLAQGGNALSDMLFCALLYASLYVCLQDDAGALSCAMAGIGVLLAMDVRGNGVVELVLIPLLLIRRNAGKQAAAFGAAAAGAWILQAAVFAGLGIARAEWSRSGAGEIAFAALDQGGTFAHQLVWNHAYTSYLTLAREHSGELIRAAVQSLLRVHDWILIPELKLLGFFVIPGLFLWFRRERGRFDDAAWCGLATLATFIWHFHFEGGRYLLAALPVIVAAALNASSLIPRRLQLLPALPRVPLRALALFLAAATTLIFAAESQIRPPDGPGPADFAQYRAGLWLASQKPGATDRSAVSRLTLPYYAHVVPADMRAVFDVDTAYTKDQVAPALRKSGCRWLVWIASHSWRDHPQLKWLATEESFSGCDLVYRRDGVSIWKMRP
jgi:hypothetical protein